MKVLNLVPESISKPTETERSALMEYLAEANNEKPEDWPTSLWGKAQAKAQRSGIMDTPELEKDILNRLRKTMKTDYTQFYGVQQQIKNLTEDMIEINKTAQEKKPINEFLTEVGETELTSLLLPEHNNDEQTTVPNQTSLAHAHNMSQANNQITNEQLQRVFRQKEHEHDEFVKRRKAEHDKKEQDLKEVYENF